MQVDAAVVALLDLGPSEPRPLARVALPQRWLDDHRCDAELAADDGGRGAAVLRAADLDLADGPGDGPGRG